MSPFIYFDTGGHVGWCHVEDIESLDGWKALYAPPLSLMAFDTEKAEVKRGAGECVGEDIGKVTK
jgi:hypothetical protein